MKGRNIMKINKMPITLVLLATSWFIVASGVFVPVYLFISTGFSQNLLITGFSVLLVSLILSSALRMFANIGQIIFDTKKEIQTIREINHTSAQHLLGLNQNLKTELQNQTSELDKIIKGLNQSLSGNITGLNRDLISEIKLLTANLQSLSSSCEQINCDSKDLNQNINQIKNFFEQIERHLDLKQ